MSTSTTPRWQVRHPLTADLCQIFAVGWAPARATFRTVDRMNRRRAIAIAGTVAASTAGATLALAANVGLLGFSTANTEALGELTAVREQPTLVVADESTTTTAALPPATTTTLPPEVVVQYEDVYVTDPAPPAATAPAADPVTVADDPAPVTTTTAVPTTTTVAPTSTTTTTTADVPATIVPPDDDVYEHEDDGYEHDGEEDDD
jgi:hypothetical protein